MKPFLTVVFEFQSKTWVGSYNPSLKVTQRSVGYAPALQLSSAVPFVKVTSKGAEM